MEKGDTVATHEIEMSPNLKTDVAVKEELLEEPLKTDIKEEIDDMSTEEVECSLIHIKYDPDERPTVILCEKCNDIFLNSSKLQEHLKESPDCRGSVENPEETIKGGLSFQEEHEHSPTTRTTFSNNSRDPLAIRNAKIRRKQCPTSLEQQLSALTHAALTNPVIVKEPSSPSEIDIFCSFLGKKLDAIPKEKQFNVQLKILKLINDELYNNK